MKKIILGLFTVASLGFISTEVSGQAFGTQHTSDTIITNIVLAGSVDVHNDITGLVTPSVVYWKIVNTDFDDVPSWSTDNAVSICDNFNCYFNGSNDDLLNGVEYKSLPYDPGTPELWKITFDLTGAANGSHFITVNLRDSATNYNKNVTYIVNKGITGLGSISKSSDDVVLYPNPARDELNVIFDQDANIKNIAVYNVIGKAMVVYRVAGGSAKLDISKIPSGVYFIRLADNKGQVVSTKRFTKQ